MQILDPNPTSGNNWCWKLKGIDGQWPNKSGVPKMWHSFSCTEHGSIWGSAFLKACNSSSDWVHDSQRKLNMFLEVEYHLHCNLLVQGFIDYECTFHTLSSSFLISLLITPTPMFFLEPSKFHFLFHADRLIRMLPEFARKSEQLNQLQDRFAGDERKMSGVQPLGDVTLAYVRGYIHMYMIIDYIHIYIYIHTFIHI